MLLRQPGMDFASDRNVKLPGIAFLVCPRNLVQGYEGRDWVEPLPFSDTPVMRESGIHLARLAWPDEANSLGARLPAEPDPPKGSSIDDDSSSLPLRPDWWPEDWPWPREPEEPVEILAPPPIHTLPRLPPDHPYHVPPGYSAPDSLPPCHPGKYYRDIPPDPVFYPFENGEGSVGDESQA